MSHKLCTSLVALSAVLTTPAFADVTAADVWANQQSLYAALGGTVNGELSADGTVSPVANFILPMGFASMQITMDEIQFSENGDGSVTIIYPSPFNVTISGGISGEGSFSADLAMTFGNQTNLATGEAGDITYEVTGNDMIIEITNVTADTVDLSEISFSGGMTMDDWSSSIRITEGDLITTQTEYTLGETNVDFSIDVDNVTTTTKQTSQPMQIMGAASLPAGGSDLFNLSQALRDGLSLVSESTGGGSVSSTVTTLNGDVLNSQKTTTGPQTASISLDENGLMIDAEANSFSMVMNDQLLFPGPIEFAMEALSMAYDLPLNASEEDQDFRIATALQGVTIGDAIWGLFDPAGQLPRDPAEISFDITGVGKTGIDFLDVASMATLAGPPPVQVDEVNIENLNIAAVGAEVSAAGAMTLDWTDFQTFPGMPRPEGAVTINLNGANALMDTLVAMGFVPAEELLMPRMMMGMFATPVGDDMLESVIEVNSEGHLLANGQRLQ